MINRDEKGRFASEPCQVEEFTDEQKEAICYKSKLLNKYFDTYQEMLDAENAYKKEHEAELLAKETRKKDAEEVKKAIQESLDAQKEASKIKREAYEKYLAACDEADKLVQEKERAKKEKLTDFCKKYPEGFHETIKIGDVDYTYNYSERNNLIESHSYSDPFTRLINWLF